ncbi:MAG: hypothetical protein ACRCV3_02690 [Desulfovibrionaceae bacterium]
MVDIKQKFILFFFSIIIFSLTGYAIFSYFINDPVSYNEDSLFLPFMEHVKDTSSWNIPERFIIFPDELFYTFSTLFTDNTVSQIAFVMTGLFFLLYSILLYGVWNTKETPLYTNLTVAVLQWALLLFIATSRSLYLPAVISLNGHAGLLVTSFLSFVFFSQIFQKKHIIYLLLCALLIAMTTFANPLFSLYFLIIPLLLTYVLCRKNREYIVTRSILIGLVLCSAVIIGFLVQYFLYPVRYTLFIPTVSFIEGFLTVYMEFPLLMSISVLVSTVLCFLVLSPFFYSLFSLFSSTIFYTVQIVSWALLSSFVASLLGFLDVYVFLSSTIVLSLCFVIPIYCSLFLKMCSVQFLSRAYVVVVFSSISIIFLTKGDLLQNRRKPLEMDFLLCLDRGLSSVKQSESVLIPEDIFSKIFLFSKYDFFGVPYNVDSFFLSNRKKYGDIKDHKYSFLIVENKPDNLKLPSMEPFTSPISSRLCGDYEVLYYNPPLVMPEKTVLASHTTQLGAFVVKNIDNSISIPLPKDFLFYGSKLSSLRILFENKKSFLLFVFPPDVDIDSIKSIRSYLLTNNSSALRHFISAMRREISQIAFLLPLEEKSSINTSGRRNIYTLSSGEHVVVLPIEHELGNSLVFLSIAEQGKEPLVIFEYPKLPIVLK